MAGCLIGRGFKKGIAFAALPTWCDDFYFIVFGDFEFDFTRFCVLGYRAQRNVQNDIVTIGTRTIATPAIDARFSNHVLAVFEGQQGPYITVAPQDDVPTSAAIAAVRATHSGVFVLKKMNRS